MPCLVGRNRTARDTLGHDTIELSLGVDEAFIGGANMEHCFFSDLHDR
jgi:hypothetical protein